MINKSYNVAVVERTNKELINSYIKCNVKLLDDTIETFNLSTQASGINLLDSVCDSLELLERDYFGIQYLFDDSIDNTKILKWLKLDKLIKKQIKEDIVSKVFYLRVRFLSVDVGQILESYTRYQLFLQIKQDIYTTKINCSREDSVHLAGYALQSELGDHCPTTFKQGYVGEFRFVHEQTPSFEAEVATFHKTLRGIRAEDAELKYLAIAKQLSQYGCDLYNCELFDKPIQLGLHAVGIAFFSQEIHGSFVIPWNSVDKVSSKAKSFKIKVLMSQPIYSLVEGGVHNSVQLGKKANISIVDHGKSGFKLTFTSKEHAKEVWRSAIDTHSFFRVRDPRLIVGSTLVKRYRPILKIMSVRTLFTGRRTMPELVDIKRRNRTSERSFIRTPSKRYVKKQFGQSNKQSTVDIADSIRTTGVIHAKTNKFQSENPVSKERLKLDQKNESTDSDDDTHETRAPIDDSIQFRPKCLVTRSVRLNKNSTPKEIPFLTGTHSTMPRKSRNLYSKSMSVDDERKYIEPIINYGTLKGNNSTKFVTSPRPSSTMYEIKSQTIARPRTRYKPSSTAFPIRPSISPVEIFTDLDSFVEVTMRAQDGKYGLTIRGGSDSGTPVTVTKVSQGSPAHMCVPNIFEGDEIVRINHCLIEELTNEEIKEIIRSTGQRKDNQLVLTVKSRLYIADNQMSLDEIGVDEEGVQVANNDIGTEIRLLEESLNNGTATAQFEKLYKQRKHLSTNEAKKSDNIPRNRYQDILPYDQTRVIIRSSDYINANVIKYDIPKASISLQYIAAQGPLPHTVGDFLTMLWENRIKLVVMLTELHENGRSMCSKYWPERSESTKTLHGYQITCDSETIQSNFVIKELLIRKSNEIRKFTQFQYLKWLDHAVPERMDEFLLFITMMRKMRSVKSEPILVHCSAGIGRTGMIIAMDIAVTYIEMKIPFSLLAIVKQMCNQRAMLIQSQKQYEFVCRAIISYFSRNLQLIDGHRQISRLQVELDQ